MSAKNKAVEAVDEYDLEEGQGGSETFENDQDDNADPMERLEKLIKFNRFFKKSVSSQNTKFNDLLETLIELNILDYRVHADKKPKMFPIERNLTPGHDKLVITFGGMMNRLGMPPAEFFRTIHDMDISSIFLKDFYKCWYHRGLMGISRSIEQTVHVLNEEIEVANADKCFTLGTSAGAYAAILYGVLLSVDRIIAFSPQTLVDNQVAQRFKTFDSVSADVDSITKYADLSNVLREYPYKGKILIYYGEHNAFDKKHAERLAEFDCVELCPVDTNKHSSSGILKKQGKLSEELHRAFDLEALF